MISGVITTRHVITHAGIIVREFGAAAYLRCFLALLRRRRMTFLDCIFSRAVTAVPPVPGSDTAMRRTSFWLGEFWSGLRRAPVVHRLEQVSHRLPGVGCIGRRSPQRRQGAIDSLVEPVPVGGGTGLQRSLGRIPLHLQIFDARLG